MEDSWRLLQPWFRNPYFIERRQAGSRRWQSWSHSAVFAGMVKCRGEVGAEKLALGFQETIEVRYYLAEIPSKELMRGH